MSNFNSVEIVFFSGTGCTEKAAFALKDSFYKNEASVFMHKLTANNTFSILSDLLIIMFPVFAANAPKPVGDFIKNLPHGSGKKTAVISVSAGGEMIFNTASRMGTIKKLENKGYDVFYEEMFVMPSNCISENSDILNAMLLKALPIKAGIAAQQIISGVLHRKKPLLIDKFISRLMLVQRRMTKSFSKHLISGSNCTGCGECAQNCPTQNITMKDQKPIFGSKCALCLKCIYSCPQKAITAKVGKRLILKNGFDLKAVEEKTKHIVYFPPANEAAKGFQYKGVREYLNKL